MEGEVVGAEAAPQRVVARGVAEARAGAGQRRGLARPGLGDDGVQREPLQRLQPRAARGGLRLRLRLRRRRHRDGGDGRRGVRDQNREKRRRREKLEREISEQEGVPIEELNAGLVCDWFVKDKLKREQNVGSAVLQWDDPGF